MGRRERALNAESDELQRFAHGLRELREKAGSPSYRQLSARAGFAAPTLSEAASGTKFPSLRVALAYVRACGGNEPAWRETWERLSRAQVARAARAVAEQASPPPYAGLARYGTDDGPLYFGRQDLVAHLCRLVAAHRIVGVVGASGSGKSSLLRAGLVPALRGGDGGPPRAAVVRICTPGPRPGRVAALFAPAAGAVGDTVVVVDHFEELFTLGTDRDERKTFLDALLAAGAADSRLRVVVAVRADFFSYCMENRELTDAFDAATLLVPAMSRDRLREAITRPAAVHGLVVERELTERIVAEVVDQPGGLPLMSHTLQEIWYRRQGKNMTMAAYHAVGGVHGAVAHTAEGVFTRLTDEQKEAARATLLRLITPGLTRADTRRPVPRTEIDGTQAGRRVMQHLVAARLLTVDGDTVELAHEALITAWPRLRGWVDAERDRLRTHRRLTDAAQTWDELARDGGALYRGALLAAACDALLGPDGRPAADLNRLEQEFLTASVQEHEREVRSAAGRDRLRRRALATLYCAPAVALVVWLVWFLNRAHP